MTNMKKTLLAIAVAGLFGATAQAATVYDADGTTLAIGGGIEVSLNRIDGVPFLIEIQDATITTTLTEVVQEGLSVYGEVDIAAGGGDAALDHASVGLISDTMGTISFGKQATIKDDSGIFNDYKLGAPSVTAGEASSGDQVIKYKFSNDDFYSGVAYAMNTEAGLSTNGALNAIDANFGFTGVENLDVAIYLGSTDVTEDEAVTYVQLQGSYTMDALTLSALAATSSYDGESGMGFGAQVAYTMDKATYSVGAASADNADIGGDDTTGYFAGVGYALSSNATAYAQIGGDDSDGSELSYAAGIDMSF